MSQLDWYLRVNLKARHLHLLVALDDFKNLSQVASNTYVSVPAVSKSLTELEKGLGIKLFERTARGLRPTIYGKCLIQHARTLLTDLNYAREELRELISGGSQTLRIGALPAVISTLIPPALALLKQRSPRTNVQIYEGSINTLLPELRMGKIDMVVGRLPHSGMITGLEEKVLMKEPVVLAVGSHHPLAKKKKLSWADLKGFPWILPPLGSLLREPLEHTLKEHGLPMPSVYIETLSTHLIRAYLQVTDSVTIFAGSATNNVNLGSIATLPLNLALIMRPLGTLRNQDKVLGPAEKLLLTCLEETAAGSQAAMQTPAKNNILQYKT
jgi:DNA-binding transcriptional LysR family regulator